MNVKYVVLITFVLYVGIDLLVDIFVDANLEPDDLIEAVLISLTGFFIFREFGRNRELAVTIRVEREKNMILSGRLNELVQHQFGTWSLTSAEKETAWLIFRGFAIKEIAVLRSVSEKTVHHQLTSVYAKSETRNRAEFTTCFIQLLFENTSSDTELVKQAHTDQT